MWRMRDGITGWGGVEHGIFGTHTMKPCIWAVAWGTVAQSLVDEKETVVHMRVWAVSFAIHLASSTTGRVAWFRRADSVGRLKARGQVFTKV